MIVVLAALTVSGYALYYVAGEHSRPVWSAAHWMVGPALPLLLLVHAVPAERRVAIDDFNHDGH